MALSWTTTNRDRVSQAVFGKVYSSLRADEKLYLDNTEASMPNASPGGMAGQRLAVVRQWSQWFTEAGTAGSTAEEVWEHVWLAEIAAHCAIAFRRNDAGLLFDAANQAWDHAIDSYSSADASSATLNDQAVTVKMVRYHVIRLAARLKDASGRRRKTLVPVKNIDSAFNWAMSFLWNRTAYEFRTRQFTMEVTSAAPSAPTISLPSGEVFDSMASRWLTYIVSSGSPVVTHDRRVKWVDRTVLSDMTSNADDTGAPEYFHIEDRGNGSRYWRWYPAPDQTYDLQGACLIAAPALSSDANDATAVNKLPPELRHLIPNLVWAKISKDLKLIGWREEWDATMAEVEKFAPDVDHPGTAALESLGPVDVYEDNRRERGYGGEGI